MTWADIKYFKPSEFDSPDKPGSGEDYMSLEFVKVLDNIRAAVGFPLKVNSGFRTRAHNRAVGGATTSAHMTGYAADIHTGSWDKTFKVLHSAITRGIKRIGIPASGTYIHLDMSPNHASPRVWFYP